MDKAVRQAASIGTPANPRGGAIASSTIEQAEPVADFDGGARTSVPVPVDSSIEVDKAIREWAERRDRPPTFTTRVPLQRRT